jgi:hypothetical protein
VSVATALETRRAALRTLWRDRFHVEKGALERAPAAVQGAWEHAWQPAELWLETLTALPVGMLRLWEQSQRGHLIFGLQPSAYRPGPQEWQGANLDGVCYLALVDLRSARQLALWATLAWIDHLLGSLGAADAPWFSDGHGCTPRLQAAAERYQRVWALGYGAQELGAATARDYWARSLELYLAQPRRLSALAPQLYRLYHTCLLRESWWL